MEYRTAAGAPLMIYYAATAVFLVLDLALDLNMRVAFLEDYPAARFAYYGVCFLCLGLIVWRPALAELVGAFESLVTLVALIITMGMRTMLLTDAILESGTGYVTFPEIVNFLMAGGVAYLAWVLGISRLARQNST